MAIDIKLLVVGGQIWTKDLRKGPHPFVAGMLAGMVILVLGAFGVCLWLIFR